MKEQTKTGLLDWGAEMRRLVELGPPALPVLIRTLDATPVDDRLTLRTIPFAMRCIDDPRAVPALIRAIPRCFGADGSDMGYNVGDAELQQFLAERHGDAARSGSLHYGRPVNEVFGALKKLTGQNFDHLELAYIGTYESDTPRVTHLKRDLYERSARRWAAWWEANWRDYISDRRYSKVNLPTQSAGVSGSGQEPAIAENIERVVERTHQGMILQPVCTRSERLCFLDLDTHRRAVLPSRFAHLEEAGDTLPTDVLNWARQEGFDLYGAVVQVEGKSHCVIKSIDTQVFEVETVPSQRLWSVELAKRLGRATGDTIAHWDKEQDRPSLDSTGHFIFITKENSVGHIALGVEVTSIVQPGGAVRADLNPQSSGLYLGRRMGLSYLVPRE